MANEIARRMIDDLAYVIESASLNELMLQPPAAGNKYSADVMAKAPGRPHVGVQGMILDAMDTGSITRAEASQLLGHVQKRINPSGGTLCRVLPNGDVVAMTAAPQPMEATDGQ